jgi:hypothetical protein
VTPRAHIEHVVRSSLRSWGLQYMRSHSTPGPEGAQPCHPCHGLDGTWMSGARYALFMLFIARRGIFDPPTASTVPFSHHAPTRRAASDVSTIPHMHSCVGRQDRDPRGNPTGWAVTRYVNLRSRGERRPVWAVPAGCHEALGSCDFVTGWSGVTQSWPKFTQSVERPCTVTPTTVSG